VTPQCLYRNRSRHWAKRRLLLAVTHLATTICRALLVLETPVSFPLTKPNTASAASDETGGATYFLLWLFLLVERSRYAAAKTGLLRLRTLHAGGLVLHWPLTEASTGCRRLAVHDARQTVNNNL